LCTNIRIVWTSLKGRLQLKVNAHTSKTYFAVGRKFQVTLRVRTNWRKPRSSTEIQCERICYGHRRIKPSKFFFELNGKYSCIATISKKILKLSLYNTKFHAKIEFLRWYLYLTLFRRAYFDEKLCKNVRIEVTLPKRRLKLKVYTHKPRTYFAVGTNLK
jgi:hypothetical protein